MNGGYINRDLEDLYQKVKAKKEDLEKLYEYLVREHQENSYQGYRVYGELNAYKEIFNMIIEKR